LTWIGTRWLSYRGDTLVYTIALLCIGVYGLYYRGGEPAIDAFYLHDSLSGVIKSGHWWQFYSPILLHFDLNHLISNLILWIYFGRLLGRVSWTLVLTLVLVSAPLSNLAEWWYSHSWFGGLSGIDCALVGFFAGHQWCQPRGELSISWIFVGIFIGLLLIAASGAFGVYSNAAHFVGLSIGLILGWARARAVGNSASRVTR